MASSKFTVSFEVETSQSISIIKYMVIKALAHLVLDDKIGEFSSLNVKQNGNT